MAGTFDRRSSIVIVTAASLLLFNTSAFADPPDWSLKPEVLGKPLIVGKPDVLGKPDWAGKPDFAGKPDADLIGRPSWAGKPDDPSIQGETMRGAASALRDRGATIRMQRGIGRRRR